MTLPSEERPLNLGDPNRAKADSAALIALILTAREITGIEPVLERLRVENVHKEAAATVALDGDTRPLCANCDEPMPLGVLAWTSSGNITTSTDSLLSDFALALVFCSLACLREYKAKHPPPETIL